MAYNLKYKQAKQDAFKQLSIHSEKGHIVDIKHIKETRSNLQNRALHKYYTLIAESFLEVGYDFIYTNPMTGELIEIPYTKDLVKEYIWRPLQNAMFEIESTTKLTTKMINDIIAVLSPWLGNINKYVKFPNRYDQLLNQIQ